MASALAPFTRILTAGTHYISNSDFILAADSTDGEVIIYLPNMEQFLNYHINTFSQFYYDCPIIIFDSVGKAATNNIRVISSDATTIDGKSEYTINVNNESIKLGITGSTTNWILSSTAGNVIIPSIGNNAGIIINSFSIATGNFAIGLGDFNVAGFAFSSTIFTFTTSSSNPTRVQITGNYSGYFTVGQPLYTFGFSVINPAFPISLITYSASTNRTSITVTGAIDFSALDITIIVASALVGAYQTASGQNNIVAGTASGSYGQGNVNMGGNALVIGYENLILQDNSVASGNGNIAKGSSNQIAGIGNTTDSQASEANGQGNMALAENTAAKGNTSVAGAKTFLADSISSDTITVGSAYGDVSGEFPAGYPIYINDVDFDDNLGIAVFTILSVSFDGTNTLIVLSTTPTATGNCLVVTLDYNYLNSDQADYYIGINASTFGNNNLSLGQNSKASGNLTQALTVNSSAEGESAISFRHSQKSYSSGKATIPSYIDNALNQRTVLNAYGVISAPTTINLLVNGTQPIYIPNKYVGYFKITVTAFLLDATIGNSGSASWDINGTIMRLDAGIGFDFIGDVLYMDNTGVLQNTPTFRDSNIGVGINPDITIAANFTAKTLEIQASATGFVGFNKNIIWNANIELNEIALDKSIL